MPDNPEQPPRPITSLDILSAAFQFPPNFVPKQLPSQTGLLLEDLSKTFVASWDYAKTGDFFLQPIARQMDPQFTASYDNWNGSSLADFLQTHRMRAQHFPTLRIVALDTCAHIADSGNRADVYVLTETTGAPADIKRLGLGLLKWRKRDGVWYYYKMQGLVGVGGVV